MAVVAAVSPMNTSASGSRSSWPSNHPSRAALTSGRSCSAAWALLFSRDAVALEEARQAALGQMDAPLGQSRTQVPQEDAGLLLGERQDQIRMGLDPVRALIPTQRLGGDVTFTGKLPAPAARAGKADPEAFCRLMPGRAGLDGSHHALAQIDGQG